MAKVIASATLAATVMPLLSRHVRQPVMVGKHDISFSRHIDQNPKDEGNDTTVPSLLFGENILPTASGYKSVDFIETLPAYEPSNINIKHVSVGSRVAVSEYGPFIQLIFTKPAEEDFLYFAYVSAQDYYNLGGSYAWQAEYSIGLADVNSLPPSAFTSAYLKGKLYTCIAGVAIHAAVAPGGAITYHIPGNTLGLNEGTLGIFTSSGYLIAWNKQTIQWSALEDPIDFIPSDVTGAGEGAILDMEGEIKFCKTTQGGFIVYGDRNAVFAQASNDFRFPFIFKPLPSLVGISDRNDVSYGSSMEHVVKSGSGIYKVLKSQVAPDFADFYTFLNSRLVEKLESSRLVEYPLDNTEVMFTVVDGSATVISYKSEESEEFDFAIINMPNLGRQGKVKVNHSWVISWPFDVAAMPFYVNDYELATVASLDDKLVSDFITSESPVEGANIICFLSKDGSIKMLLDSADAPANGTVILGPFQLAREAMAELTRVEATVAKAGGVTTCTVLTSITGEDITWATLLPATQLGKKVRYNARVTGLNHSICIQGAFDLSSVLLELVPKAKR